MKTIQFVSVVLSSLNLAKYDEWKNTNIIYDSIWFLDGVLRRIYTKELNTEKVLRTL